MVALPRPCSGAAAIHRGDEVMSHAQKFSVDNRARISPPAAATVAVAGVIAHGQVAASWVMRALWPSTTTSPLRLTVERLGSTTKPISMVPCGFGIAPNEIHEGRSVIDQAHSRAASILSVPFPPPAPNDDPLTPTVRPHLSPTGLGARTEVEEEDEQPVSVDTMTLRRRTKIVGWAAIGSCSSRQSACHVNPPFYRILLRATGVDYDIW
jgi:hypothetical protein